jgi:hypothetical protein
LAPRPDLLAVLIAGVVGFVLPLVVELGEQRGDGIRDADWILIAAGALVHF